MAYYQDKSPDRIPQTLNTHDRVALWLANFHSSNYSVDECAAKLHEMFYKENLYFNLDSILKLAGHRWRDKKFTEYANEVCNKLDEYDWHTFEFPEDHYRLPSEKAELLINEINKQFEV